jgi:holo-[acyl-carrier protein] synthase
MTPARTPTDASSRLRVGIDLVRVSAVRASIAEFGERYLDRLFSPHERACCGDSADAVRGLAARVAAKEATMKVLRPTSADALPWRSIEVRRVPGGWTELALTGDAAALAKAGGLDDFAVSLSHEDDYATAVVVARAAASTPARLPSKSTTSTRSRRNQRPEERR